MKQEGLQDVFQIWTVRDFEMCKKGPKLLSEHASPSWPTLPIDDHGVLGKTKVLEGLKKAPIICLHKVFGLDLNHRVVTLLLYKSERPDKHRTNLNLSFAAKDKKSMPRTMMMTCTSQPLDERDNSRTILMNYMSVKTIVGRNALEIIKVISTRMDLLYSHSTETPFVQRTRRWRSH